MLNNSLLVLCLLSLESSDSCMSWASRPNVPTSHTHGSRLVRCMLVNTLEQIFYSTFKEIEYRVGVCVFRAIGWRNIVTRCQCRCLVWWLSSHPLVGSGCLWTWSDEIDVYYADARRIFFSSIPSSFIGQIPVVCFMVPHLLSAPFGSPVFVFALCPVRNGRKLSTLPTRWDFEII